MNKFNVALVEDDIIWQEALSEHIQKTCEQINVQCNLQIAKNTEEAQKLLSKGNLLNMLCTDIGLKEGLGKKNEGMDLAATASMRKIPTIVVSGTPSLEPEDVRTLLKEFNVIDFFSKNQFNEAWFNICVRQIIEQSSFILNANKLKFFISYSSRDESRHLENLLKHFSTLQDYVEIWLDQELLAGEEWSAIIKQQLEQAEIVLYLVTANSIASKYIQEIELPLIKKRCAHEKCTLIPIIVDFCNWKVLDFAKMNVLPKKGEPITNSHIWINEHEAWLDVIKGIERVIENINGRNKNKA